jgi:hypothetical protein
MFSDVPPALEDGRPMIEGGWRENGNDHHVHTAEALFLQVVHDLHLLVELGRPFLLAPVRNPSYDSLEPGSPRADEELPSQKEKWA